MASEVRIEQVGAQRGGPAASAQEIRRRRELYATSQLEDTRRTFAGIGKQDLSAAGKKAETKKAVPATVEPAITLRTRDGLVLEAPRLSVEQRQLAHEILAAQSEAKQAQLRVIAVELGAAAFAEVAGNPNAPSAPHGERLASAAGAMYENYVMTQMQVQQEENVNNGIMLGLWGLEQNMTDFFRKVAADQAVAQDLKTDINEIKQALADWPDDGSLKTFDYREVKIGEDGSTTVIEHKDVAMTKEQAQQLVGELGLTVEHLGQIETRDTFKIQKMMHDWKTGQETVSNVLKAQHETHKTLINNAKA